MSTVHRFFLSSCIDAIAGLVTFPFVLLRNVLQPIIPRRLLQMPPVRNIIHKCVSVRKCLACVLTLLLGTLVFSDLERWFSSSVLRDPGAPPSSRSFLTNVGRISTWLAMSDTPVFPIRRCSDTTKARWCTMTRVRRTAFPNATRHLRSSQMMSTSLR